MQPHLRQLNIERFSKVLEGTSDPVEQARIKQLIVEERAKPDAAYPDLGLCEPPKRTLPGRR